MPLPVHCLATPKATSVRCLTRTGLLLVNLFLGIIHPGSAEAQSSGQVAHVVHLLGLWTEHDEKSVSEALDGWDELQGVDVSREAHRVKFSARRTVSDADLTERLAGTGTSVFWVATVQPDGSLSGPSYDLHAFPILQDTGDPAADNAQYEAAKAAWIAAHPGWVDVNSLWDADDHPPVETVK